MRRVCAVGVWLLLVAPAFGGQIPPPPPPPPPPPAAPARDTPLKTGTATIRGRVVADGTNAAVPGVEVRINASDSPATKFALTDVNGRFELASLPAGKFTVTASKPNYVRLAFGQTRPQGQGQPIELADGQTIANIDFSLQRTGVIAGRILDEFGDPVTDVQVIAMRYQFISGERRMMRGGGRPAMTNDLGDYRIYGLPPGQYFVTATLRNFMIGETDDRSGYAPTYYPGTGNVAEAQRLTIAAGQTMNAVNMTLLPVRTARISGKAVDADNKPLAGAMVMAIERRGMMAMPARSPAQVRPDGSFTLSGITTGNYTITVMGLNETAIAPITVTDGDVTDVQLVAEKPSTIRGRVLIERGVTPPRASTLQLFASSTEPMMRGGQGRVNDDFTFELKAPAGHYAIRPSGQPDGWYLHAVRLNGIDVTDTGIDVPANAVVSDVAVEMTTKVSGATGTVMDEDGKPVRDAWVVMFAQDSERWKPQTRYVGAGRPNMNNVYTVNVPAGDYFLIALTDVEPGEWNDPDFLAPLRERATRVTIADGERKTVDLKVAR